MEKNGEVGEKKEQLVRLLGAARRIIGKKDKTVKKEEGDV